MDSHSGGTVSTKALFSTPQNMLASVIAPHAVLTAMIGAVLAMAGGAAAEPLLSIGMMIVGGAFVVIAVLAWAHSRRAASAERAVRRGLTALYDKDAAPVFVTDADGAVVYQNGAAEVAYPGEVGSSLAGRLGQMFANPGAVLFRLRGRAAVNGSAREDVVSRMSHVGLSVQRLEGGLFLWRLDSMRDGGQVGAGTGVGVPMMTVTRAGMVLFMNQSLRRLVGGRARSVKDIFGDDPVENGRVAAIAAVEGPVQCLISRHDGDAGRSEIYCVPISADFARRSDAARISLDSLPVPLARIDAEGRIEDLNGAAARLFDQKVEHGMFVSDLFEGLGRSVSDWLSTATEAAGGSRPEVLRVRNPDKEIYLQVSLVPVEAPGDSGRPGLLAVLDDATELKTLEAQFVQSQKMQAIGQLAGGVAHDFNNLLTAISGHCDLLLLRHDQGDPEYVDLVQIHQNANRAASLVGQLLAFSRKQNLQPEVLDVRDTLSDLTHLLNRLVGEKVSLALKHAPDLMSIRADKRQLEQVFMNLVVNARDAMPDGGQIEVSTKTEVLDQPLHQQRATVPAGEYVIVRVSDQGVGIPEDKIPKIFEPFYTTKRQGEGTGLGLSTAYGIVKQTGGFIFADNQLEGGTMFSLYFPACRPEPAVSTQRPVAQAAAPRRGEGVILLVEDEAPVRAFASRALRMRGYKVIEAENAEQALETLRDETLDVDVFVTDVIMPGLDGPTWVMEALKQRPDTRVVFVSGYAEGALSDQQSRIPNSVFLPKPFSLNELTQTVMDQTH